MKKRDSYLLWFVDLLATGVDFPVSRSHDLHGAKEVLPPDLWWLFSHHHLTMMFFGLFRPVWDEVMTFKTLPHHEMRSLLLGRERPAPKMLVPFIGKHKLGDKYLLLSGRPKPI